MKSDSSDLMWNSYFLRSGDGAREFWKNHLSNGTRNVLYVIGLGFDPRMCDGLRMILSAKNRIELKCLVVEIDEGADSITGDLASNVSENRESLIKLMEGNAQIEFRQIDMWKGNGLGKRRVGQKNATELFRNLSEIENYSDIIVDISALPRGIYLPLISKLFYLIDQEESELTRRRVPNLHVIVSENVSMDNRIQSVGVDEKADYIIGSGRGGLDTEQSANIPRIWIPILGEGQGEQLERIYELISPDEICPVLPSPSENPRRGDNILLEYRELLFVKWMIEPRNMIYASENNPFEAYRRICEAVRHYDSALKPLGGCLIVVSANSSKLLSIGALLSTHEMRKKVSKSRIGLAHVDSQGYNFSTSKLGLPDTNKGNIFTIWLLGECYND